LVTDLVLLVNSGYRPLIIFKLLTDWVTALLTNLLYHSLVYLNRSPIWTHYAWIPHWLGTLVTNLGCWPMISLKWLTDWVHWSLIHQWKYNISFYLTEIQYVLSESQLQGTWEVTGPGRHTKETRVICFF